jgi:ABC-type transporter Mla subunit MlaD
MDERTGFRAHFAVGLLTIALLAAGAVVIGFFLAKESPLERTIPIGVRFADVSGLKIGAPVELQGYYVGRVTAIALADPQPPRFPRSEWEAVLAIRADDPALRRKLTETTVFSIQAESVFGNKYVNATFGDGGAELAPGVVVPGAVGAGIDARTFEKLSVALDNLSGAAAELKSTLGGVAGPDGASGAPNLKEILANLDTTLKNSAEASVVLKDAVSPENQAKLKQTFDDLSKSAQNLANVTDRTKQGMDSWAELMDRLKFWNRWFRKPDEPR